MKEKHKEELKESLHSFVRLYLSQKKIFHDEFEGLGAFFHSINVASSKNYMDLFNNHLVDSIVTSLLIFIDRNPEVDIQSDSGKDIIVEQITKAISVAKTTFAYAIHEFQKTLANKKL